MSAEDRDAAYLWDMLQEKGKAMNWKDRISVDATVCHGKPCIKGTRVLVSVILDNLAAGESHEAIVQGYHVAEEDIQAALQYAAELARDRLLMLPTGSD